MSWEKEMADACRASELAERRAIYRRYGLGLLVGAALIGGLYALRRWLRGI